MSPAHAVTLIWAVLPKDPHINSSLKSLITFDILQRNRD